MGVPSCSQHRSGLFFNTDPSSFESKHSGFSGGFPCLHHNYKTCRLGLGAVCPGLLCTTELLGWENFPCTCAQA